MELVNRRNKIFIISGKARSGKDVVADLICEYYQDKRVKKLSYAYYLKQYVKDITGWSGSEEDKPRSLLQSIGIDILKKIDENFLVNRVCEDILVYSNFYDIIVITDARLISEIEIPKSMFNDIVTIRVNRMSDNSLTPLEKKHITETGLDNYNNFDYNIENNDDYNELVNKVNKILEGVEL